MAIDLFDGSDPSSNEADFSTIKINEEFAKRFEHNKRREAFQRLKELKKRGLASNSDDSEESSDEDDAEDLMNIRKKDLKFFETLVRLKKDPTIFQKDTHIYSSSDDEEEQQQEDQESKKKIRTRKKERPLYLKDVNAQRLIEEGPEFEEKQPKYDSKIYNKEQAEHIKAFLEAEKEAFASYDDEDEDDIFKEKKWFGEEEGDPNVKKIEKDLDEYFGKDDELIDENDKFIKDYLWNKMWIDKEKDKKPSFEDIAGVSEDEDELDKQDKYEAEYNFRHEEEEADRVLGHSRFVEGSVRKKTSSRKVQRKHKEERLAQVELERKEELKHLKNIKKKHIQEKLDKIRAVAGIGEGTIKFDDDDLEDDFDPEEYDKKMKEMFGDEYYKADDADPGFGSDEEGNMEKPDFNEEDELLGLPKGWETGESAEGFEAASERFLKQKHVDEPKKEDGKRKRKRKLSLKEKVELDKELEEYYKLDYEGAIGDLKTRFKYRSVPARRYHLRPWEILMADDKDLKQYVSLKKLAPYTEKEWEVSHHRKLNKDLILKGTKSDGKSGKKHKLKEGPSSMVMEKGKQASQIEEPNGEVNPMSRASKRRRRQAELKPSLQRFKAYGKIPSKTQKKH